MNMELLFKLQKSFSVQRNFKDLCAGTSKIHLFIFLLFFLTSGYFILVSMSRWHCLLNSPKKFDPENHLGDRLSSEY